jgi:hypothetical protein
MLRRTPESDDHIAARRTLDHTTKEVRMRTRA